MPWGSSDAAYLAGLIDGEGSISVFASTGNTKGTVYQRHRLILCVYNTYKPCLDWIAETFGGKVREVRRYRVTQKTSYVWQTGWQHAATVLRSCVPHMKIKHRQALLFIECAETMSRTGVVKKNPIILERRRQIATQMSLLNRRGSDALVI